MLNPKWGKKYICFKCGVRFYDLGKQEPTCPKCGANQTKARSRTASLRARRHALPVEPEVDEPEMDEDAKEKAINETEEVDLENIEEEKLLP